MENNDLVEALKIKIEALEIKNEALGMKIEALELRNSTAQMLRDAHSEAGSLRSGNDGDESEGDHGKKRGRRPRTVNATAHLQEPMEAEIHSLLSDEHYNRATYRAIAGIMLCLYDKGKGNVNVLFDYIGGSRVTIVRHTAMMKKQDLLRYEGSRKKGYYVLTDRGKEIVNRIAAENS